MSAPDDSTRELKIGGPVDQEENLYIARQVDEEFFGLLRAGEYVNIVTSRQMGKTSLVYRAIARLAPEGMRFAYFDLSRLRSEPDARRYFSTLIDDLARELKLGLDLAAFWAQNENKANGQVFMDFFRLVLEKSAGQVVVVLDEIDSTLESAKLGFTDDLFTAIRSMYTIRPREALFKRLSFCLVGVATPNELIKARRTTPYNIGRTLWLGDFDPEHDDLSPLARRLSYDPLKAQVLLGRVLLWTGGQPYLTMWLCDELRRAHMTEPTAVDALVESTYTSLERLRGDTHFEQVQRFLGERPDGGADSLDLYERILKGTREPDQPANPAYVNLKLSGLVKRDADGVLAVRSPIYARLFDADWVRKSRPRQALRKAKRLSYVAVALLVLGLAGGGVYYQVEVAPLKAQEEARRALEKLGVFVPQSVDGDGLISIFLAARDDAESMLQKAQPHLENIGVGDGVKGMRLSLAADSISNLGPVGGMKRLVRLDIAGNKVADLAPLAGLKRLTHLDAARTSVASLAPLADLANLEWLNVSDTKVSDLSPLGNLTNLQALGATGLDIPTLAPLARLTRIRELAIAGAARVDDLTLLGTMTKMEQLDIAGTAVRDLTPLSRLVNLQYLNVSKTKIKSLAPLDGLAQLRLLEIDGLGVDGYSAGANRPILRVFGGLRADAPVAGYKPGQVLRDCDQCPEMVVIPAGRFVMGSAESEKDRDTDEGPQRQVEVRQPFAVGKFEVTFEEWDACFAAGGCTWRPEDRGWGRGRQPVMNVGWQDAQAYAAWLSKKTGKHYRLLSEAEWEYVARAGSTSRYPWGDEPGANQANFDGSGSRWSNKQTAPVGSFPANAFGVHDMIGNVWEWTDDCYQPNYEGASMDIRPRSSAVCGVRVVRGGLWNYSADFARVAFRSRLEPALRNNNLGFRLARTL